MFLALLRERRTTGVDPSKVLCMKVLPGIAVVACATTSARLIRSPARHASDGAAYLLGENYPRRSCICRGVLIRGGHHFHSPLSGFAGAGGCSNDGPRKRRHPSGPTSVGPMRGYARPARSMVAPKAKHWGLPALALHWSLPFPG